MLAQWAFFLASGHVPELQNEPWQIALHLASEFITAIGLIAAGVGVLRCSAWATKACLFFSGMLCYSLIASPGYFIQLGQWSLAAMFVILLILMAASVFLVARTEQR
jgi:hypothetical protein